jgi:hypothetical protein
MTPEQHHFSAGKFCGKITERGFSGVSVLTQGPARGHNLEVDATSLRSAHALLSGKSLPAYLTHSDSQGDRLGREIGVVRNFRLDGKQLRGDFDFLESFREHQPGEYDRLRELAQEMPDQFGLSVVFTATKAWPLSGGKELPGDGPRPADALTPNPAVRFASFESVDFVKSPAANVSLFKKGDAPEPAAPAPAPQPGAFAAQLAERDRQIQVLGSRIEFLATELEEAKMFDARFIGVPHEQAPAINYESATGVPSGEGMTDQQKWAKYAALMKTDPSAAARFRRQNIPNVAR